MANSQIISVADQISAALKEVFKEHGVELDDDDMDIPVPNKRGGVTINFRVKGVPIGNIPEIRDNMSFFMAEAIKKTGGKVLSEENEEDE